MGGLDRLRNSVKIVRKPLTHIKKVKHARWLIPGWVFYEYYKVHKAKGQTKIKSFGHGVKAEAFRLITTASLPVPGTYELTTTGLALIKGRIEIGDVKNLTLKAFKDFIPTKKLKTEKNILRRQPYLRIFSKDGRLYFRIFYK